MIVPASVSGSLDSDKAPFSPNNRLTGCHC
jgi:hypothetical protein